MELHFATKAGTEAETAGGTTPAGDAHVSAEAGAKEAKEAAAAAAEEEAAAEEAVAEAAAAAFEAVTKAAAEAAAVEAPSLSVAEMAALVAAEFGLDETLPAAEAVAAATDAIGLEPQEGPLLVQLQVLLTELGISPQPDAAQRAARWAEHVAKKQARGEVPPE